MGYQSFGSPQRPKGATMKFTLKVILVLVVCAWLVYQIMHSMNKTGNYGGQSQTQHVLGYGAVLFGRKGLDERALPILRNVNSVGEDKGSSNGRVDDNTEQESVNWTNGGNEVEPELESQHKEPSSRNEHNGSSLEESGNVFIERKLDHKDHVIDKYQKRLIEGVATSNKKGEEEELKETPNAESDFLAKENDKDTRTQESVVEGATNAGATEGMDDVLSFHDENGVPPDGNETKIVAHEDNMSKVSKGIRVGKVNAYKVTFGEDNGVEVSLGGQENNSAAVEEFNSQAFTHGDISGIKDSPEIEGGDGKVL